MTFDSLTLYRAGPRSYQVTLWPDGTVRWDGDGGDRIGAWQATVDPSWMDPLSDMVRTLPSPTRTSRGAVDHLVIETGRGRADHAVRARPDPAEAWCLAMVVDGICTQLNWSPLDSSGAADFSPWAHGCALWLQQGRARGLALALREGVLLLAGSTANTSTGEALEENYKSKRTELLDDGSLRFMGDVLLLKRHLLFTSPSAPARLLIGSNTNGRRAWRDANGSTWAELGLDESGQH
ncbi:MAG: DUF4357 domain-containing protein [Candidatus Nanopelagicales bacterium]|nr:DUF4357 domain-containing protein [Candidatus Nanopelagicales bacterium]